MSLTDDSGAGSVSLSSQIAELVESVKGLEKKMTTMKRELVQETESANEKLAKKFKEDKPAFKKKGNKKQYEHNAEVQEKVELATAALKAVKQTPTPPEVSKALKSLEEGMVLIGNRQKLIRIADRSDHGWATVEEYMEDELADGSDDEKRLYKAEARAAKRLKELNASKQKQGKGKARVGWRGASSGVGYMSRGPNLPLQAGISSSQPQWVGQPSAPSIRNAGTVSGPCFLCGRMGHFRKACPMNSVQLGTNNSK